MRFKTFRTSLAGSYKYVIRRNATSPVAAVPTWALQSFAELELAAAVGWAAAHSIPDFSRLRERRPIGRRLNQGIGNRNGGHR